MNCADLPAGMNRKVYTKTWSSPLAPSTVHNTVNITTDLLHSSSAARAATEGQENSVAAVDMDSSSNNTTKSWWVKVCNRIRAKHRRPEKCEKCGQRSDTCLPNASFISGRKHFLCQDCRASSHNMKTMYQQLCRNLSLRDHSRTTTCTSGDLSSPGSSRGGLSRSKSLKVARPTSPESGYETATSVESSSSVERLSEGDPASTSSRDCGGGCGLTTGLTTCLPAHSHHHQGDSGQHATDDHLCSKDRAEVFGGAFRSEKAHLLHHLQQAKSPQRIYSRHPAAPSPQDSHPPAKTPTTTTTPATKQYDGYLEIRTPNSRSVKYVFKKPEGGVDGGQPSRQGGGSSSSRGVRKGSGGEGKECYRCHKVRSVAFRAPFGHGWLCENCMDDLM